MGAAVLVLVGVIVAGIAYLLYRATNPPLYDKVKHFNGPKRYPIVGALPLYLGKTPNDCYYLTRSWYFKEFRSPMLIKAMDYVIVFLFDARHVEALFKSRTNITKMQPLYAQMSEWLGASVLTGTGSHWHRNRRLLTPTFHSDILKEFIPIMHRNSMRLVEYYLTKEGQPIDVRKPKTLTALDNLAETSLGRRFDSIDQWEAGKASEGVEFVRLMNVFMDTVPMRRRSLLHRIPLYYQFSEACRKATEAIEFLHRYTKSIIHEREATLKQQSTDDSSDNKKKRLTMIDTLLSLKKTGELDTEQIRSEVDTFMFAGHDTTATQLIFLSFKFGTEPEWQRKVQQEIDNVVGDGPIQPEHFKELVVLDRFVKETLRLYPSVPEVGRTLDEDLEIEPGVVLPKGLPVFVQIQGLHMNKDYWPNPEVFDPDRFLPDNIAKRHPFAYVPFAAGLRNCIGQRFALMELKIVMATLLQHLNLHCSQSFDDLKPMPNATLSTEEVYITFTRREKHRSISVKEQ